MLTYPESVAEAANAGADCAASCAHPPVFRKKKNKNAPRIPTSTPIKHPNPHRIKELKNPSGFPKGFKRFLTVS